MSRYFSSHCRCHICEYDATFCEYQSQEAICFGFYWFYKQMEQKATAHCYQWPNSSNSGISLNTVYYTVYSYRIMYALFAEVHHANKPHLSIGLIMLCASKEIFSVSNPTWCPLFCYKRSRQLLHCTVVHSVLYVLHPGESRIKDDFALWYKGISW